MSEVKGEYTTESGATHRDILHQVIEWLVQRGWMVTHCNSGRAGSTRFVIWRAQEVQGARSAGVSDIVAVPPGSSGRQWVIEVKTSKDDKPEPWQVEFLQAATNRGCIAIVLWDVKALEFIIYRNYLYAWGDGLSSLYHRRILPEAT